MTILMLRVQPCLTFSFPWQIWLLFPWWCRSTSAYITVAAFLLGAMCSGIAGYVGMWVSVRANVRVASAARRSAREALQVICFAPLLLAESTFRILSWIVVLFADSRSGWWFLCNRGCWYGCDWCCHLVRHILCLAGGGFTRFNESYRLWVLTSFVGFDYKIMCRVVLFTVTRCRLWQILNQRCKNFCISFLCKQSCISQPRGLVGG